MNINWDKIRIDSPKAFDYLITNNRIVEARKGLMWSGGIIKQSKHGIMEDTIICDGRDLYEFFDELGIFIRVKPVSAGGWWKYHIRIGKKATYKEQTSTKKYENRRHSETEGFIACFEELEQKLKREL